MKIQSLNMLDNKNEYVSFNEIEKNKKIINHHRRHFQQQ